MVILVYQCFTKKCRIIIYSSILKHSEIHNHHIVAVEPAFDFKSVEEQDKAKPK